MLDERALRGKIIEKGFSTAEISKHLNINPSTFYRKAKNNTFTVADIDKMIGILGLIKADVIRIFFYR